nr:MAG TPA: hypothetical protein [Inoviridae sp.]
MTERSSETVSDDLFYYVLFKVKYYVFCLVSMIWFFAGEIFINISKKRPLFLRNWGLKSQGGRFVKIGRAFCLIFMNTPFTL